MFISLLRFILKGWVYELYIAPKFYFPFYGFEWVKPLGAPGMYMLFGILLAATICITVGLFYRMSVITFFLGFTYIELIDKSNYLNHYYFICIVSFLLIFVPAHRYFSLDARRSPTKVVTHIPRWYIFIFQMQLGIVYFYAGLAKLNADWLLHAMPLRIWLPANAHLPLIGNLLDQTWVAYLLSWFGAAYDLCIVFLLFMRRTRWVGYVLVVVFHLSTAVFFQIGMFPYIMMLITLIFFSEGFHKNLLKKIASLISAARPELPAIAFQPARLKVQALIFLLAAHFTFQLIFPFRYLMYPDNLFWTEQGYRFSWRVMLMEKAGTTFFYVKDAATGKESEVFNLDYLTKNQEKMMATQPDMILQFAHLLEEEFRKQGIKDPVITVKSYVTLNGNGSKPFIDPNADLTLLEDNLLPKNWILPYQQAHERQ